MDWDNYPGTDLGSLGHEDLDARTWAEWGADYVKYDWCGAERDGLTRPAAFAKMRDAIARTGRPMVYSISEYGDTSPWTWARPIANSWRTTSDIKAEWSSVMSIVDNQAGLEPFSGPGAWNDPDMLQVGNGSLTTNENRAHYSLWALLGAPLMLGNDLREMNQSIRDILTNRDVIAVNQDWGGSQGRKIRDFGLTEVWAKPMADGSVTVALLNRGSGGATISTSAAELGLAGSSSYDTKDLWTGATGTTAGAIGSTVDGHGVTVLRVNRSGTAQAGLAAGTNNVGDLSWAASSNGWGPAERNRSNGESGSQDGTTLRIASTPYTTGIGVHADSAVQVHLGRACTRFTASVGIDDEAAGKGSARFAVYGDGRLLAYTDVKTSGQVATPISVSVAGVRALELRVTDGRDGIDHDHADWADAKVTCGADAGTAVAVGDLPYAAIANGWGPVEHDASNAEQVAGDGSRLTLNGVRYPKGLGVHAPSVVSLAIPAGYTRFTASAGVDDEAGGRGSVIFTVHTDGANLYSSQILRGGSVPATVDVDITGRTRLDLKVSDAADGNAYDHADWADAHLLCR
jgi:alpha-galactosidase